MKKIHIIGIIIIAVCIGVMMTSLSDSSTYATFKEATNNPGEEFHVVGKLNRNKDMIYDPKVNADVFSFYMTDNEGLEKHVILHKNKPQDFERSEQIVLIGKMEGNDFHANEILMKCPSKYNDGKPQADNKTTASR